MVIAASIYSRFYIEVGVGVSTFFLIPTPLKLLPTPPKLLLTLDSTALLSTDPKK
jgi:hypothetical protein